MGVPVREPVILPWTVDCVPVVPASLDPLFVASYPVSTPAARRLIHVYICFSTGTTPCDSSIRHSVYSCSACCYHLSVRFVTSFRFSDSSMVSSLLSE